MYPVHQECCQACGNEFELLWKQGWVYASAVWVRSEGGLKCMHEKCYRLLSGRDRTDHFVLAVYSHHSFDQ
jgi:hypothetical protein